MNRKSFYPIFLLLLSAGNSDAQMPSLTVKNENTQVVKLKDLDIKVAISGSVATTTWTMTFHNNSSRTLEGTLNFPLPSGVNVSGFALDINGKLRDAVAVEKEKATIAFDNTEKRQIDPALLEKTEGNNFRTRIYPINSTADRIISITYEEALQFTASGELKYNLPLSFTEVVPHFTMKFDVLKSSLPPVFTGKPETLNFIAAGADYTASVNRDNYIPGQSITVEIPKKENKPEVAMQLKDGKNYFLVNSFPNTLRKDKALPDEITIIWDASLSGITRDHDKELQLLDDYFSKIRTASVILVSFSNKVRAVKKYEIRDADLTSLKKDLRAITYDGGTQMGNLYPAKWPADEYLFFGDGLANYLSEDMHLPERPVYTISASVQGDPDRLRTIAAKTGGSFIDLVHLNRSEALKQLTSMPFAFMGIKAEGVSEFYPSLPQNIVNGIAVAGVSDAAINEITLLFGYGGKVTNEQKVQLDLSIQQTAALNVARIFAERKIDELSLDPVKNEDAITAIAKTNGLASDYTSLLVLEAVSDYVRYNIDPPAELKDTYLAMKKKMGTQDHVNSQFFANASTYWNEILGWYGEQPVQPVAATKRVSQTLQLSQAPNTPAADTSNAGSEIKMTALMKRQSATDGDNKQVLKTVTVTAQPKIIDAQYPTINTRLTKDIIKVLPVTRTADMVSMASGAVQRKSGSRPNIGGARGEGVLYVVDGVQLANGESIDFPPGAIAEIQVLNSIPARFGDASGGVVLITTNSYRFPVNNSFTANSYNEYKEWIKPIDYAKKSKQYAEYLHLRESHLQNPSFYFQVAGYFFSQGDRETGMQILSNMADLGFADFEVYKMMGYKLREIGEHEDARYVFKKLLEWRPMDPQSWRDYALALEDSRMYQQAFDTLYTGIRRDYDGAIANRNGGIQEVMVTEINNLANRHKDSVKTGSFPQDWIRPMAMDIRVVVNWNQPQSDIDLWVFNPQNEKCFFEHKNASDGGRISSDLTEGFGPEQYMLKKAGKGKYRIAVNYFSDDRSSLSGPTTIQAEVYTNYGTPDQKRQLITLQMTKEAEGEVYVGNFSF